MAYDEALAHRVRAVFAGEAGLSERKMFGGLSFMLSGNMCCGIVGEELMVRRPARRAADGLHGPCHEEHGLRRRRRYRGGR